MEYYHNRRTGSTPFQANDVFSTSDPASSLTMIRSHIFALVFCYLVGVFGLSVFYIIPILILFWNHWRECYATFVWITRLRCEYYEIKKTVHKNSKESVRWVNEAAKHWWSVCHETITHFVQDWMEPIACKFKLEHVVEYLKILSFNVGPHRSVFSNLQILQKVSKPKCSKDDVNVFIPITFENLLNPPIVSTTEGKCTYAVEVDAQLNVPSADFKMQAKLGGIHQKMLMNIESFCLSGRVQCVVNVDRRAPFPHISTADLCFLPTPKLKVNCRTLKDKVDISATPILKQIGEKYIEREFQRILVYPKKEHVDFTPSPLPGNEWTALRELSGLAQGVLTVKLEPFGSENKKSSFNNHYVKLKLGSQKCSCDLQHDEWSSIFSFLIHDCNTEKLRAKLKARRRIRQSLVVQKMEIPLFTLGIGGDKDQVADDGGSIDKKVQMSGGDIQFLFSLSYTALPSISLTYPIPSLDTCSMEDSGVLYIHVHGCRGISSSNITSKTDLQPYCIVRQGSDTILKTHTLSGSSSAVSHSWEKGIEILIRSCRGLELMFEIFSDTGPLTVHDSIGWATLRLNMGQSQLIQNRLQLTCPIRKLSKLPPHPVVTPPCIYVSVIYRNVESVNLTRDSLQKAFFERTGRQGSTASCLDHTTRFLNPTHQGYDVMNASSSSDEEDEGSYTGSSSFSYSNRVVSSPEESLRFR